MTPLTSRCFQFSVSSSTGRCEPAGPDPRTAVSCIEISQRLVLRDPLLSLPPAICSVAAFFTSSRSALLSFLSSLSPAVGPLLFCWDLSISSLTSSGSALVHLLIVVDVYHGLLVFSSTILALREGHRCFMPSRFTTRDVAGLLLSSFELVSPSPSLCPEVFVLFTRGLHGTP